MRTFARLWIVVIALVLCQACAVKVVPLPTATAQFDPVSASLTEVRDEVAVTVKVDQLSVQPYQLNENLAPFSFAIDNRTDQPFEIAPEVFVLRDEEGHQFRAISPEKVKEIVSKDTVYLIPYPYVGYYYLEDQERYKFAQPMTSSLPFYAEYHPQDIFTRALPVGPVLPRSKISGVIYFLADPTLMKRFELLLYADEQLSGEPRYRFPFGVE